MIAILLLAGFLSLAAGTWRQSRILFGRPPTLGTRRAALLAGYALIAAALAVALADDDPAQGVVAWFGLMTIAALFALGLCWVRGRSNG